VVCSVGRTPAVCCASNSRTAQCLSAVVLHMMEIRSFASMSVLSEGSSAAVVVEQQGTKYSHDDYFY
jgi:hypothetical protein